MKNIRTTLRPQKEVAWMVGMMPSPLCILQSPLTCVGQIRTCVASEGYHVIITANIPVDGMAKQEGKV